MPASLWEPSFKKVELTARVWILSCDLSSLMGRLLMGFLQIFRGHHFQLRKIAADSCAFLACNEWIRLLSFCRGDGGDHRRGQFFMFVWVLSCILLTLGVPFHLVLLVNPNLGHGAHNQASKESIEISEWIGKEGQGEVKPNYLVVRTVFILFS